MRELFQHLFDAPHGEYKRGERCQIMGFTYQDIGPVVWTVSLDTGILAGCNPSEIKMVV